MVTVRRLPWLPTRTDRAPQRTEKLPGDSPTMRSSTQILCPPRVGTVSVPRLPDGAARGDAISDAGAVGASVGAAGAAATGAATGAATDATTSGATRATTEATAGGTTGAATGATADGTTGAAVGGAMGSTLDAGRAPERSVVISGVATAGATAGVGGTPAALAWLRVHDTRTTRAQTLRATETDTAAIHPRPRDGATLSRSE